MTVRILIRCDGGPVIGSGHVMRCLSLAHSLVKRGAEITFATTRTTSDSVPALAQSGHATISLDHPLQTEKISATGLVWDAAVVDHYALSAPHESALRRNARVVLAIDDLADRQHECDLLCDQTVDRNPSDYASLVPAGADLCIGAEYALLRPEFARARPGALAARADTRHILRILISLGMTDLGGITAWATNAALAVDIDAEFAIALGSKGESVAELQTIAENDRRVVLHLDCSAMWDLMATSDLAIGAAGTTSWERCCLGLPSVIFALAENQALIAQNLEQRGAAIFLPQRNAAALATTIRQLADDHDRRSKMSRAAAAITDGNGAVRLADRLISKIGQSKAAAHA